MRLLKFLLFLAVLLSPLIITSCLGDETISDQELVAELATLTLEQQLSLLHELEEKDQKAIAGLALSTKYKLSSRASKVSLERIKTALSKVPISAVPDPNPQCGSDLECPYAYSCIKKKCLPKPCQQDAECPANFFCENKVCTKLPADLALTSNLNLLNKGLSYEEQLWQERDNFKKHVFLKLSNSVFWEGYSSTQGWAVYHTLPDFYALSWAIDVTASETHRSTYAALGKSFLDLTVPMAATGAGTSEGQFRYLDEAHALGAAGMIMNAIYEHPNLRNKYQNDLVLWAQQLKPLLDKNILRTKSPAQGGYLNCDAPYMSAKVAPGYLAVGKILQEQNYIDGFTNIVEVMGICLDQNAEGWIGGDLSHALISTVVLHLAHREAQRGNLPEKISEAQLGKIAGAYFSQPPLYYTDLAMGHASLARFSETVAQKAVPVYTFNEVPGSHSYTRKFETVAGFAMGFATKLSSDSNK